MVKNEEVSYSLNVSGGSCNSKEAGSLRARQINKVGKVKEEDVCSLPMTIEYIVKD